MHGEEPIDGAGVERLAERAVGLAETLCVRATRQREGDDQRAARLEQRPQDSTRALMS